MVATGFFTTELPIAEHVTGRAGRTLAEVWGERGMAAYKGTTVPGFPNLFFLVGPNTGLGHSEHGLRHRVAGRLPADAVRAMREGRRAVEPDRGRDRPLERPPAAADGAARSGAPAGAPAGTSTAHGRNTTLWPRATFTMRASSSSFDAAAYHRTPLSTPTREDVTA